MKKLFLLIVSCLLIISEIDAQKPCQNSAELDSIAGKYENAAAYPYPARRAEYFRYLKTPAEKALAKRVIEQIENLELKSRANFNLTGGVIKNQFDSADYEYYGKHLLGGYRFDSHWYEYYCAKGKQDVSPGYSTVLRIGVNLPLSESFGVRVRYAFGGKLTSFNSVRYKNWKANTKITPRMAHMQFLEVSSEDFLKTLNSGKGFYQTVPENEIRKGERQYIQRIWFFTKNNLPYIVPVSRKEFLEALLEYYEIEKEYFDLRKNEAKPNWASQYAAKKASVQKILTENNETWLMKQAIVDRGISDNSEKYGEFGFERFSENANGVKLYKFNDAVFSNDPKDAAKPKLIIVSYRFVPLPSSLRLIDNFTKNFDFNSVQKLVE